MIKNPNWQEATSWLQCLVGLNPGQLETNPDQRLGQHLNQGQLSTRTTGPRLVPKKAYKNNWDCKFEIGELKSF